MDWFLNALIAAVGAGINIRWPNVRWLGNILMIVGVGGIIVVVTPWNLLLALARTHPEFPVLFIVLVGSIAALLRIRHLSMKLRRLNGSATKEQDPDLLDHCHEVTGRLGLRILELWMREAPRDEIRREALLMLDSIPRSQRDSLRFDCIEAVLSRIQHKHPLGDSLKADFARSLGLEAEFENRDELPAKARHPSNLPRGPMARLESALRAQHDDVDLMGVLERADAARKDPRHPKGQLWRKGSRLELPRAVDAVAARSEDVESVLCKLGEVEYDWLSDRLRGVHRRS